MRKRLFLALALSAAAVLFPRTAVRAQTTAGQPLQELFQTETVYPQQKGETQLIFASTFSKSAGQRLFQQPLTIEYGLTNKWQVTLEWVTSSHLTNAEGKTHGPGDLRIGTKHSWMNIGHSNFHLAAGFELGLPTGSVKKGLGEGRVEYAPYVVVARDFPRLSRLQIFSQLGLTLARSDTGRTQDKRANKTLEWNNGLFVAYRQARFTTEINWSKSAAENGLYLTPGIIWKLPGDLEVGVGMPIGLTREADQFRTIVQLVYEFGGRRGSEKRFAR